MLNRLQTRLDFFSLLEKKLTPMLSQLTSIEYPRAYSKPTVMTQMKCLTFGLNLYLMLLTHMHQ